MISKRVTAYDQQLEDRQETHRDMKDPNVT